jgi:DNA-binding transcriptional LysR family regulator
MVSASQSYRLLLGRPAAGSPLLADPRALLLSFGATEMGIRYSGGSLASVVSYLKAADALTVVPHSAAFAWGKEKTITALPINIPQLERALAILRRIDAPRSPAIDQFSTFVQSSFDSLKHLIKRHDEAVVWSN